MKTEQLMEKFKMAIMEQNFEREHVIGQYQRSFVNLQASPSNSGSDFKKIKNKMMRGSSTALRLIPSSKVIRSQHKSWDTLKKDNGHHGHSPHNGRQKQFKLSPTRFAPKAIVNIDLVLKGDKQ